MLPHRIGGSGDVTNWHSASMLYFDTYFYILTWFQFCSGDLNKKMFLQFKKTFSRHLKKYFQMPRIFFSYNLNFFSWSEKILTIEKKFSQVTIFCRNLNFSRDPNIFSRFAIEKKFSKVTTFCRILIFSSDRDSKFPHQKRPIIVIFKSNYMLTLLVSLAC